MAEDQMVIDGCGSVREGRIGHNTTTASGKPFWPLDPRPDEVRLVDVATALSNMCRFNGHVKRFYSVAQHSVLVSLNLPVALAREGLLHDAAEAYVGDMVRPLKKSMAAYREIEARVDAAVRTRFGLPPEMSEAVKQADLVAAVTEKRDLLVDTGEVDWGPGLPDPWPDKIEPWCPSRARYEFLFCAHQLGLCEMDVVSWSLRDSYQQCGWEPKP